MTSKQLAETGFQAADALEAMFDLRRDGKDKRSIEDMLKLNPNTWDLECWAQHHKDLLNAAIN